MQVCQKGIERKVQARGSEPGRVQETVPCEKVDFSKYKDQLKKLLDKYVTANDVEILSQEINLADMHEFNQFIEDEANGLSKRSQAKAIAAQTSKVIRERYKQDEVFYKKFSDRIRALLDELKAAKADDVASLFNQIKQIQNQVENYEDSDIPESLRDNKAAHSFFRNTWDMVSGTGLSQEDFAEIIEHIVKIIKDHRIVDFHTNIDVRRRVLIEIEDFLLDDVDVVISPTQAESIAQKCWTLAVENKDSL